MADNTIDVKDTIKERTNIECSCSEALRRKKKRVEEESFALTLVREYAKVTKSCVVLSAISVLVLFATIVIIIMFLL